MVGPVAGAIGPHETMVAATLLVGAMFLAALAVPDVRGIAQESIAS